MSIPPLGFSDSLSPETPMSAEELRIPTTDYQLQCALEAMRCPMRDRGDGSKSIVWPLRIPVGTMTMMEVSMGTLRRRINAHGMIGLLDLRRYLLREGVRLPETVDWKGVSAAMG